MDAPPKESPYLELQEYFRNCEQTPVSLTFRQIEIILCDNLDPIAYFYESFWYDDNPGMFSSMWKEEGFPFHDLQLEHPDYCIADCWLSQGYEIKRLHLEQERIVFRRTRNFQSGLKISKALTDKKIPDEAAHEINVFLKNIVKKYGL